MTAAPDEPQPPQGGASGASTIRARQLVSSSTGLGLITLWSALLGLFTTPYLIGHLGASRYGIFALLAVFSNLLMNLEFGFGHAMIRYLARARAAGDEDEEAAVVQTSLSVFLAAGLVATALVLGGSTTLLHDFVHGPRHLRAEALASIRIGALMLLGAFLASFCQSALQALGKFSVVLVSRAIFGTLSTVAAVTAVAIGGHLRLVLYAQLATGTAQVAVLGIAFARSTLARVRPAIHGPTFRAMAGFGVLMLASGLGSQAMMQAPPAVLARFGTIAQVASFSVPNQVLLQLAALASASSIGFLPFVSAMSVRPTEPRLAAMYKANLRVSLMVMGPIAAYLAIFGHTLLSTWINARFGAAAAPALRWLAIAAIPLALSGPAADGARGMGKPGWVVAFTGTAALVTLGLALALVHSNGAGGVAAALLVGLTVSVVPFVFMVGRNAMSLPMTTLAGALAGPALAIAFVAGLFEVGHLASRSFVAAVLTGLVGTPLYVWMAWRLVVDGRERAALVSLFRRGAPGARTPASWRPRIARPRVSR